MNAYKVCFLICGLIYFILSGCGLGMSLPLMIALGAMGMARCWLGWKVSHAYLE